MITMEKIDYVMDVTGSSYEVVRAALLDADGDVDKAINLIRNSVDTLSGKEKDDKKEFINFDDMEKAIRDLWEQGLANRLVVEKNGEVILSLSLAVSAFGAVLAPLAALVGVGAGLLNDYDFKLLTKDKQVIDLKESIKENIKKHDRK